MRDNIASCFNEHAVKVSDSSCSNPSNLSCYAPKLSPPSIKNSVICTYKTKLSTRKQLFIRVNWCKNPLEQGLSIINGDHDPSSAFKTNTQYNRLFRKKKGHKYLEFDASKIEIFWDISAAKYNLGPEPVTSFYVIVMVDSELGLVLGDMGEDAIHKKFRGGIVLAQFCLISRREHFSGGTLYSTKAQFSEIGATHDISIRCSGEDEGLKHPALSISIDKRRVILVKRLHWNFRGNQTIFVDGLTIDLMWDVYDWLFDRADGYASFMFRTRSVLDSRLWLEEKLALQEQDRVEFSLLIYACKNLL